MDLKHFGAEVIGIKAEGSEKNLISSAAGYLIRDIAKKAVLLADGNGDVVDQKAAREQKAAANKKIQAIGAAVSWLYNNHAPMWFTPVDEGLKVEVGDEPYAAMSNDAVALLNESLQAYSDATVDAVAVSYDKWSLSDYRERASKGADAAVLARQLHDALMPNPEL